MLPPPLTEVARDESALRVPRVEKRARVDITSLPGRDDLRRVEPDPDFVECEEGSQTEVQRAWREVPLRRFWSGGRTLR